MLSLPSAAPLLAKLLRPYRYSIESGASHLISSSGVSLSIVGGEAEVLVVKSNFGVGNEMIVQALMAHLDLEWVDNAQR